MPVGRWLAGFFVRVGAAWSGWEVESLRNSGRKGDGVVMATRKSLHRVDYKGQACLEYLPPKRVEGEKSLMIRITTAVASQGGVLVMRNQVGRSRYKSGNMASHGLGVGSADLVCIVAPWGRWCCIEVKREKGGVISPAQVKWLSMVRRYGAVSGVAKSVEDALALVNEARNPPEWQR